MADLSTQPARKRLGYYDTTPRGGSNVVPLGRTAGAAPSLDDMVRALIDSRTDWSVHTTQRNCGHYLLGSRWKGWCARQTPPVLTAADLTTSHVEAFLAEQLGMVSGEYLIKFRTYFRALAAFQATHPGWGEGLLGIDRVHKPKGRGKRKPPSLSRDQERELVRTAQGRDQLLVEFLLATGLRVSELAGLTLDHLHLDERQPYVHVLGSIHDADDTKGHEDRDVPFRPQYRTLPKRLRVSLAERTDHLQCLFLSEKPDERGKPAPLTVSGIQQVCERLGRRIGVHVFPHLLRHTWATRLVDANFGMLHLKQLGGWKSVEMVEVYYRADNREVMRAFAKLRES